MSRLYYKPKLRVSLVSRGMAFATSLALHAGLAGLVYFVGVRVYQLHMEKPPEMVEFVQYAPRTLEQESTGGSEPTEPPELVPESLPAFPARDAPETMVKTGGEGFIPSGPDAGATNFLTMGPGGSFTTYGTGETQGTGIIGDRSAGGR